MLDQFLELYRSVADHPIDWRQWFVAIHYAGLAIGLGAALVGDGLAVKVLLASGRKPSRRRLRFIHASIVFGLCLVWVSGIGLIVQKFNLAGLPVKIIFKLAVATILSLNALMIRDVLIPISQRVRRPIASGLSSREALGVAVIGAVSIASWVALACVALVPALQALALETLFAIYGGMICGIAIACLATIGIVRLVQPRPPEGSPRRRRRVHESRADAGQPRLSAAPDPSWAAPAFGAPQLIVSDDTHARENLTHRLRQTLAARQSNDNDSQVREQLERERVHQHRRAGGGGGGAGGGLVARLTSGRGGARRPERRRGEEAGLEPAPDDPETDETHLTLRDIRARCRRALFGVAAVSLVSNLLMLTGPLFMLQIYDRVLTSKSLPTLTALFALAVALFAFMGVLDLIRSRLLVRVGLRVDRLMNARIFDHAIAVASPADVKERAQLHKDLGQVRQFISGAGTTAIFDMPWVPVYFAIVVMFHDTLGAVALAGAGALVVLSLANEFLSRKPVTMAAQHAAEADRLFEAGRQQREVLHAMGMMPRYRDRWVARHSAELMSNTRAADIAGLLSVATKIARLTLQAAMLAAGAYLVLAGEITPGVMIASSIIMSRALAPIEQGIAHWRSFIAARQGLKRLGAALEASSPQSRLRLPLPEGHLRVENLFAGPIGAKDPVLKGLEFALAPGEALGVLGPSGSGKSTLARVLVGVWPVIRGRVCLDGAPLDHWPLEQVGEHIGYLPQDAMLFEGTVADNIARFDVKADPAAIIAAARTANVHDMILGLGDGYNTRVGEGGAVLSGGQRQRIALARALYGGPALVVLDEPNSNLDQAGEEALAEAIATMRRAGRTVVVMAHRRKALEHVSHILVLKDGRQSAFGDKATILGAARQSAEAKRSQNHAAS